MSIADWIRFYNFERPHQSLDYKTPWETYQKIQQEEQKDIDQTVSYVVSIEQDTTDAETSLVN